MTRLMSNICSTGLVRFFSLAASLVLSRSFDFGFDVNQDSPLQPGDSISARMTLIGGGFSDTDTYPLRVIGTTQNGATFDFTVQVRITPPGQ